ncbi:phosphate ABC transporter substrate-binding protein PstS [Microbacterium sp. HMWF026]|uniref:phosphate ABC transporter substrate-binding protein PstS n=1 Tax=Microbacterium sp. HMWF026 TaxID=2056861 RepID=UPI000D38C4B4|nr:phosphate ABC transporter substrate-binding protein PstS [Microbacterium sp. HMWF026]PTT23164.1 phosphate ABC transporter substrate-binding protein PstS [Microbacterium sp. HMWF026]
MIPAARGALVAVAAMVATLLVPAPASAHADDGVPISGAGSTWSQNALDRWRRDVALDLGMTVNYSGTGSAAGRRDFIFQTVDFAVSEVPFQAQPEDGGPPQIPTTSYAYVPLVAGGTALMYNLKIGGVRVTDLRLSGPVIARIFSGQITTWNDPAIQADNPAVVMPDRPIIPVVRADGSGSSAQFTGWMADRYPNIWTYGARSQFPLINGSFTGQNGSLGVAGYVSQNYGEGAITYVETSYATRAGFPVAKVLNDAGYYVAPASSAVSVALSSAKGGADGILDLRGVHRSTDPRSYPISSVSYMIVPTETTKIFTADKGRTLSRFLEYALCEGQQTLSGSGYAPLPLPVAQTAPQLISRIPGATKMVDLDGCRTPMFAAGDTATDNLLLRTAPMPPETDRYAGPATRPDEVEGVDVSATVTASDLFQLTAPASSAVDFGDVGRGSAEVARSLGRFSVVDDRNRLGGWNLQLSVSDFVGTDDPDRRFSSSFLGIAPREMAHQDGVTIAEAQEVGQAIYPMNLATGERGTSTTLAGATFDADLRLRVPGDASAGAYRSMLTLTLIGR